MAVDQLTISDEQLLDKLGSARERLLREIRKAIVGQDEVVEHLLLTMLVGGHCLITGMPGTAKTLLVRTLADALGLSFKRIQFTPDLMPTDVTGTDIIEAPFFVLATQNPIELEGTYPLPEAQLDRFLFNVLLDYLSAEDERLVVERNTNQMKLPNAEACTNAEEIVKFQWLVRQVPMSDEVGRKAVALVRATRPSDSSAGENVRKYARYGASIRATQFLALAAKARALSEGRYHVMEDDLRALALPVLRHRVLTNYQAESDGVTTDSMLTGVVDSVLSK